MKKTIALLLTIVIALFASCADPDPTHTHEWEWKVTTPATPTADGLETETCKTCGAESGNIRIIEQTEPTVKTFSVTFNFENGDSGEQLRNAVIKDERTNCGSQNLEQLGIVTVIKEATMGAFTTVATGNQENQKKNMFRTVFGVDGGVTIIVNNPATLYKLKAPDKSTIYFHIDYLKSNPSDIQQITFDALTAMLTGGASLPYNAEYTTPHQTTITAFGKTATVTGDAALSTADFNTAKGKLQEAMTKLSSAITAPSILERYGEVLGRVGFAILIKTGNAGPDADANKSMTIGVDYLLNNDAETTIAQAINKKIYTDNAFADPATPHPATITQGTPNGLAFAGSVTIKSDDTYTPAEWDAVVAKVVAALNRGYSVDDGDGLNELMFEDVFNRGNSSVDIEVLVLKSASYNIEVKSGEYGKLYLKESSLDTINVKDAVWAMSDGLNGEDGEYQANAAPPKRRAFLANGLNVTPSACPA